MQEGTESCCPAMQGYHSGSLLVSLLGIFKAVVGIIIRPTVGLCEFMGKSAHGVGLLFLGREGISGAIQKRVRAPGTLADDSEEVCYTLLLARRSKQLQSFCCAVCTVHIVLLSRFAVSVKCTLCAPPAYICMCNQMPVVD